MYWIFWSFNDIPFSWFNFVVFFFCWCGTLVYKTSTDFVYGPKTLADDQFALVGKPIRDEDLISCIVGGLNLQSKPFVLCYQGHIDDIWKVLIWVGQLWTSLGEPDYCIVFQ